MLGKDGISFSCKYDISVLMIFSQKNTIKDSISGIIEKDDIHPRKYGISSDRKIKDDI